MKQTNNDNTPKTLSQLRKDRQKLQSELDALLETSRTTRFQATHSYVRKHTSINELKDKIREIDLILEERKYSSKKQLDMTGVVHSPKAPAEQIQPTDPTNVQSKNTDTDTENILKKKTMEDDGTIILDEVNSNLNAGGGAAYVPPQTLQPPSRPEEKQQDNANRQQYFDSFRRQTFAPMNPNCGNAAFKFGATGTDEQNEEINRLKDEMQKLKTNYENQIRNQNIMYQHALHQQTGENIPTKLNTGTKPRHT